MATLKNDVQPATPSVSSSPTPPPIPSTTTSTEINGRTSSYRRSSKKHINNSITSFYQSPGDNESMSINKKKRTGQLIDGAPTKEHRLLEYFLVISYGEELKIRHRSPLMDIFENFNKRTQHHHAYILQPNQSIQKHKTTQKKRKTSKISKIDETKQTISSSPKSSSKSPPKSPPPPLPTTINNKLQNADYANIESIRASKDGNDPISNNNNNPFASLRFEPSVIDRFPPLDHEDTAIVSTDTQLQYFCLPTGLFLTKFPSLPIFYTFVWTPESGEHLYGCCLRFFEPVEPATVYKFSQKNDKNGQKGLKLSQCKGYFAPKCICIISYHSFIEGYRTFLTELYRLSLTPNSIPIERYLCNFFLECPLPPRGYFSVLYKIGDKSFTMARAPSNNPLSKSSISTRILFELFTIDTIMNIYKCMLMEEKILFISTQYSILSLITEIFVSLLYPFSWPHVYIPMLPEDFLAFLKAPTVFIIGTQKSLLLQIGDELDADIMIVDINKGTICNGNAFNKPEIEQKYVSKSMQIELPKHEKLKLVRFLTPVSNLLYGARQHDFHQLDLAFPVAPTPDMIEEQESLQRERLNKLKSHSSHSKNDLFLKRKDSEKSPINEMKMKMNEEKKEDESENNKKTKRFSLNFKFKRPKSLAKMGSLKDIGMNFTPKRRDSIEPPIKNYIESPFPTPEKKHKSPTKISRSKSEAVVPRMEPLTKKKNNSGTLQDIVESPINAIFDDAAVRNGFLRFWLSIFRSYNECVIRPNGSSIHHLGFSAEPIYEDSATMTTTLDVKSKSSEFTKSEINHSNSTKNLKPELSKSKSVSSITSSVGSNTPGTAGTGTFGQSADAIFDEEKFLKSSPSQSRPFLKRFICTESFNRFITKCVYEPHDVDVKYFNEKIIQKLGRSRFTKALPTPFLNNKDYVISHEYICPSPYILDLDVDSKYIYPNWPKFDTNLYIKARRKYPRNAHSKSSQKDIVSNYNHLDEPSITFEPSKSQTITSIISPPRSQLKSSQITPRDAMYNDDGNIIHEDDENENDNDQNEEIVLQLNDFNKGQNDQNNMDNNENPFSHDRVTYHLWFYIFIKSLQPNNENGSERALHLMIKIMAQMKNEGVGLPDEWIFLELIESMQRMNWQKHVLKLVEVMQMLDYEMSSTIYSSLLNVLSTQYGTLEAAYNVLGNLPQKKDKYSPKHNRRNSLLMNCDVKPERGRKKYYETIKELQNRFSTTFPGRSIIVKQECPFCGCAVHDVHIRIGWSNDDRSVSTQCPECNQHFDAKFVVKEFEEYSLWIHDLHNLKSFNFFRMRGAKDTFIEHLKFESAELKKIKIGDQIMAINGCLVLDLSMKEIYELLKNPPLINENNLNLPEIETSISSSNYSESGVMNENNEQNKENKLKKQSTKSKLMKLMKRSNKEKEQSPVCITFRRAVLCPYFSPLILYREIKKVMQNHALSLSQKQRKSVCLDESKKNDDETDNELDNEYSSYRKQKKDNDADKEMIKNVLQQSGISAISSIDFRLKHCELFWNLAWHFSNLRLPIHFLQNAFDEDSNEMNTQQIDELIEYIPLNQKE